MCLQGEREAITRGEATRSKFDHPGKEIGNNSVCLKELRNLIAFTSGKGNRDESACLVTFGFSKRESNFSLYWNAARFDREKRKKTDSSSGKTINSS